MASWISQFLVEFLVHLPIFLEVTFTVVLFSLSLFVSFQCHYVLFIDAHILVLYDTLHLFSLWFQCRVVVTSLVWAVLLVAAVNARATLKPQPVEVSE